MALALWSLWLARSHLAQAGRTLWRGERCGVDEAQEPLSYRSAVLGFGAGLVLLVGFGVWAGMSGTVAGMLFVIFFLYMMALTRLRAEAGTAWHFGPWVNPNQLVVNSLGSAHLDRANLTGLAGLVWFNKEQAERLVYWLLFESVVALARDGALTKTALTARAENAAQILSAAREAGYEAETFFACLSRET